MQSLGEMFENTVHFCVDKLFVHGHSVGGMERLRTRTETSTKRDLVSTATRKKDFPTGACD